MWLRWAYNDNPSRESGGRFLYERWGLLPAKLTSLISLLVIEVGVHWFRWPRFENNLLDGLLWETSFPLLFIVTWASLVGYGEYFARRTERQYRQNGQEFLP